MFLVMSPHVQTNPMNSNVTIDANTSQDSARGDMKKDSSAPPTILFLHGNAGNIGHRYGITNQGDYQNICFKIAIDNKVLYARIVRFRLLNVKDIVDRLHCNVCLLEYRGYGHSDGTPSEEGIYMDAQAALDYLTTYQRSDVIDPRKV